MVASSYANNNYNILRAQFEIAQHTYRKHWLITQLAKTHLSKLKIKLDKAAHDTAWLRDRADAVSEVNDAEWADLVASAATEWAEVRDDSQLPNVPSNNLDSMYQNHPLIFGHPDTVFDPCGHLL